MHHAPVRKEKAGKGPTRMGKDVRNQLLTMRRSRLAERTIFMSRFVGVRSSVMGNAGRAV